MNWDDEQWWRWRWDTFTANDVNLKYKRITRWRRGSLLTVYRIETLSTVEWAFYIPFNLSIAFSRPRPWKWS